MKRVLVVHYSQTGQLTDVVNAFVAPLLACDQVEVVFENIAPQTAFPFPWPFWTFFSIFPETVFMRPAELKPLQVSVDDEFDLVILAYTAWFLSPSLPISSFLQTDAAANLLKDKPVVTLIACRDMWLTAQEKVKGLLTDIGAHLIDNVALVDKGGSAWTFMSTPLWMFTGKKGPWGRVPRAGIDTAEIAACDRFGERIADELCQDSPNLNEPMLTGLGAVTIKEKTIASEVMAHRSFKVWSRLLMCLGGPDSIGRRLGLVVYVAFLLTLILTLVPISALIKKLLAPYTRGKTSAQKAYYAHPSGESRERMKSAINNELTTELPSSAEQS